MADFFLRLQLWQLVTLRPFDLISTVLKNLNLLKKYFKYGKTSYNFSLGFALSNRHQLHKTYFVTVWFYLTFICKSLKMSKVSNFAVFILINIIYFNKMHFIMYNSMSGKKKNIVFWKNEKNHFIFLFFVIIKFDQLSLTAHFEMTFDFERLWNYVSSNHVEMSLCGRGSLRPPPNLFRIKAKMTKELDWE